MKKHDFILPDEQIYMCGHSLGPLSKASERAICDVLQTWGREGVQAWETDAWIDLPSQVAQKIARLLGAKAEQVVMADSTSVNLFKVLMAALKINSERRVILTTEDNFPADSYIAQGIGALGAGISLKIVPRETLFNHFDEQVAAVMLTHVNYRDARTFDMQLITAYAHQKGIITIWDLSHSTGAVPLSLAACDVDFAVGCTYKYLNGGPGAPAFIYAHKKHCEHLVSPLYGWMGHVQPFAFDATFQSCGVKQFVSGTPYILSLKALHGALECLDGVDMFALHQSSLKHSGILISALREMGLEVITPAENTRGGHVAFLHEDAEQLAQALLAIGVICDYRKPGLIRLCVNPLYLAQSDIHQCVERIKKVLAKRKYEKSYALFMQLSTYSVAHQADILTQLAKKHECLEEIQGARDAMAKHSIAINYPHDVLDIVGTGGDRLGTFNISTAASIVVASCGVNVAKHGGRSVSSQVGSTDVIHALGIPLAKSPNECIQALGVSGYAYLQAPVFNPELNTFAKVRKHIRRPTIFNIVGPLLNPIAPAYQVIGVYRHDLLIKIALILQQQGLKKAIVVHAQDGLDEISICAPTHMVVLENNMLFEQLVTPEEVGLKRASLQEIQGGDALENARILEQILTGKLHGPKLDIVLLNSAAGLLAAQRVDSLAKGVDCAREAITSGRTAIFFKHLIQQGGSDASVHG